MDSTKIEAITSWEEPKTVKDIRSFLGFANFYYRFIEGFSLIVSLLTRLTQKDRVFKFDLPY
jgi:hypothetical protein